MDDTKFYEDLALRSTPQYEQIDKALEVVKQFIEERGLILYGGISIDYALKKAKHKGIYSDDAIPDYDVMSPNYNEDARDLAIILQSKGFLNVSDINAIHFSTRRVRVEYETVADITYIPKVIFDKIPTLEYNGLKFAHPNYQKLDMHKELCYPFENPPREVVLHRSANTIKRFKMLNEIYPIKPTEKSKLPDKNTLVLPIIFGKYNLIGGFAAYALLYAEFEKIFSSAKLSKKLTSMYNKLKKDIIKATVESDKDSIKMQLLVDNDNLRLTLYSSAGISEISKQFKLSSAKNLTQDIPAKNVEYYNSFIETLRHKTIIIKNAKNADIEIFDTYNSIITNGILDINGKQINVCTCQQLLLYFLQKNLELQNGIGLYSSETKKYNKSEIFISYYLSLSNIIVLLEQLVEDVESIKDPNLAKELANKGFFLSSNAYGTENYTYDYITWYKEKVYKFQNTPHDKREILKPPFGFYPENNVRPDVFKIEDSDYFQFDGQKRDKPFVDHTTENLH